MPIPPRTKTSSADALAGIWNVTLTTFIIGALYFGKEIIIPLALAALLTFLLSPLANRLQRYVGKIASVLMVVAMIFALTVSGGWVLTTQLMDLGARLPDYKENIRTKIRSAQLPTGGALTKLSEAFDDLKKELPIADEGESGPVWGGAESQRATPVRVVDTPDATPFEMAKLVISPVLGPLGTAAMVLLLLIFMLLQREDLRGRLIRLIGQGRIGATTRAMDDAATRVTRYLLMQLVVNVTYGIPVAIGLYFIGVPNAILWGAFAAVLRFIPYAGPWIAAAFPIILSLAVSPDWTTPLLTISLFVVLELLSNNVMEPWLYGSSTGVSSLALIVAAVFWTWLWGPVGLVLATPITVCLVVMGRHIPKLSFLSVILSDEEALTPAEDCYHRLLRTGEHDEMELVETYLKNHTQSDLYDSVLMPVIVTAETDHRLGLLDKEQLGFVQAGISEILDELDDHLAPVGKIPPGKAADRIDVETPVIGCSIYSIPARAERDELAGSMLAQLLQPHDFTVINGTGKRVAAERIMDVKRVKPDVVCISVVPPSTVSHARYLCLKIKEALPEQKIVVGLWGHPERSQDGIKALLEAGADEVVTSFAEVQKVMAKLALPLIAQMIPAPIPDDEEDRLKALRELNLLEIESHPQLDAITHKLARVFGVPMAFVTLVDRDQQFFKSQTGLPDDLADTRRTSRDVSICGHAIAANNLLVIGDLARDRRFANNPLVKERGLRFYAGAPIHAPNGQPIGSLCLMDTVPRQFTEAETRLLKEYSADISQMIARDVEAVA
jgi:predicted PurR-regulated permease PerM